MGIKNAPAIHQHWVTAALCPWIGRFCHIYMDNIAVWSRSLNEHTENITKLLQLVLCWPWPEARSQAKPSQNVGLGWLWPWPDLLKSQSHWPGPRLKRPIRRSRKRSSKRPFDGLQCKSLCTTLHFTKTCMHKYLCLVCIISQ